jgi:hypothetical protein
MLVHPESGATAKCKAEGTGIAVAAVDSIIAEYVRSAESQGYVSVDKLTPEQREGLERRGLAPR